MRRSPAAWACRRCARSSRICRSASSIPTPTRSSTERLETLARAASGWITEIEQQLAKKLADRGIAAEVSGRRKRAYSIWRKMERKAVGFEQLSDIFGFRVVVGDLAECYQALGIVHTTWPVVPGRFKDYISTPKQNDYRSIHTTVIGPGKQRVELQIRTREMQQIAEYGIAAHALYKDGVGSPTEMLSREFERLCLAPPHHRASRRRLQPGRVLGAHQARTVPRSGVLLHAEGQADRAAARRDADRFRLCGAHRRRQHGDRRQDQRQDRSALISPLQNGDEVQILTSKAQTAPPAAWESIVVTGKARAAIRRATRAAVRNQYSGLGRRIVERLCQRAKIDYSDEKLEGALPRLARASIDDVMSAVGRGEMKASDVVRAMYPDYKDERVTPIAPKAESGWFGLKCAKAVKFKVPDEGENGAAIPIRGINTDLPVRFAPQGGAVPGDRIVGIMTPGEGITIYPIQSEALEAIRGPAGALARRALGCRRPGAAAVSGAACGAIGQRAGVAGADRPGDRRARRQYRQYPHDRGNRRTSPN